MMILPRMHQQSNFYVSRKSWVTGCFVKVRAKVADAYTATRAKSRQTVGELSTGSGVLRKIQKGMNEPF